MGSDVWIGALTTLMGALLGGAISFALSRQQLNDARMRREEEDRRAARRRSEDRRFQAYSDYLAKTRSYRDAVQAYYLHLNNRPLLDEIDNLLHTATNASNLVFLVVETEDVYRACIETLKAIWGTQQTVHQIGPTIDGDPWTDLNNSLGRTTREFQNAARRELEVIGPAEPWIDIDERSDPDILDLEAKARNLRRRK